MLASFRWCICREFSSSIQSWLEFLICPICIHHVNRFLLLFINIKRMELPWWYTAMKSRKKIKERWHVKEIVVFIFFYFEEFLSAARTLFEVCAWKMKTNQLTILCLLLYSFLDMQAWPHCSVCLLARTMIDWFSLCFCDSINHPD